MTFHSKSRVVTNSQLKIKNRLRYEAEGPRGGADTQVETSHGMPELTHCHCKRTSQLGPQGSERCRESVRTSILRDDSGITVINHPIGEISEVEGGWCGIGAMVTRRTGSVLVYILHVVSSFLSVGLEDATAASATPLSRA